MPCFKGLAVSIHTPEGPLPEHSVQKQTRFNRISSYIPVPPPKIPQASAAKKAEQSTFAISITLLTPGQAVPYSTSKPTPDNPYPRPRLVSALPNDNDKRGHYAGTIGPYVPLTASPNETIAAYIYFDGRAKEEVATLLRRGEETWVNSRWVGIPESEGGGLAEREFLFREVGLERWLNGLDLEGKDAAAKIERRRQKIEKKRRRRRQSKGSGDEAESSMLSGKDRADKGVLRYGADEQSPLEQMSESDDMFLSESDSDDDPVPESAGQIKVALFRVLASGEIRKGEYSPQFDAHDDSTEGGSKTNEDTTEEVDHTTSFAQPKTLDPKSISTQTVTGIDSSDKPFAVFTFLYRGEKQLQKMGILASPAPRTQERTAATSNGQRRSMQADFAKLKPLNPNGLKGFTQMRDPSERSNGDKKDKSAKRRQTDVDSDEDLDKDDTEIKFEEGESSKDANAMLSPEDARRQDEVAEGVQRIKLKRQHSANDLDAPSPAPAHRKSPPSNTPTAGSTPPHTSGSPPPLLPSLAFDTTSLQGPQSIGSPLKKARASLSGNDDEEMRRRFGLGLSGVKGDVLGAIEQATGSEGGNNVGPVARDSSAFGGLLPAPPAFVQHSTPAQEQQQQQKEPVKVKEEAMEEEEEL